MKNLLLAFVALAFASPAQAEWRRADSQHFVVYANDRESDVVRFADMLERYHAAMALITGRNIDPPSPSNRVTIFVVGGDSKLRKLAGGSKFIGGFYIPRAGASRAFVPNIQPTSGEPDFSMIALMHEYAHHFLIGSSRFAMPTWMSEGAAEFFASARFPSKGGIEIGRPARHRAAELFYAKGVPIRDLLDRKNSIGTTKSGREEFDAFYGRSWALYHYLWFNDDRKGQLQAYALDIAKGKSSLDAAEDAFGDLDRLDKDLDRYIDSNRMLTFVLPPEKLNTANVRVITLSEGMNEVMPLMIETQRGVDETEAAEVVREARLVAAKWPDDAGVLAELAEAEFDSGNDDAAIAAADRALAIDPSLKNAYVQKGFALFHQAENATPADQAEAFKAAMVPFSKLNALEQDSPLPLIYYYRSYVERGEAPSENARHALERAAELAPFDQELGMNAALMEAGEGKIALAIYNLRPIAANPHGGAIADAAQHYIALMAGAPEGEPWSPPPGADLAQISEVTVSE